MTSSSYSRNSSSLSSNDASGRSSSNSMGATSDESRSMRLAVFDLDYTVWQPEMYQLYGNVRLVKAEDHKLSAVEKNETRTLEEGRMLTDKSGTPIRVFSGA
jgi:Acid Phosphatase